MLKRLQSKHLEILTSQKSGCLFVTPQLKALSQKFKKVRSSYEDLQREIVQQAMQVAATYVDAFQKASFAVAELDCVTTLAFVALMSDWVVMLFYGINNSTRRSLFQFLYLFLLLLHSLFQAPSILAKGSRELVLEQLRHPIIECQLGQGKYIPSDLSFSQQTHSCILTGPNMGGKSTFLRAVGICVILAHIGSFVPASAASVPLFDHLSMRVGAEDCAEKGQSTFLAEMDSIAKILDTVTADSLVLVDELGRGTSTQVGLEY